MNAPTVTVCIPTYNYAHYLDGAIASVLDQTYEDFELLIADDVSSDDTAAVVARHLDDPRVRFMPNDVNRGMFANFNRCIEAASGRYIKFLMADDWLASTFLERMVALMEEHSSIDLATAGGWVIDGDGTVYGEELQRFGDGPVVATDRVIRESARGFNPVGMPTCTLVRTTAMRAAGGFDASYTPASDIALWFRLLNGSDLGFVPEPLSFLRIHSQHTHEWGDEPNEILFDVWRDAVNDGPAAVTPRMFRRAARRISISYIVFALKHLRGGDRARARRLLATAVHRVGAFWAGVETIRQIPRLVSDRLTTVVAGRRSRSIRYSPYPRIGAPLETVRAEAAAAMGPGLQSVVARERTSTVVE